MNCGLRDVEAGFTKGRGTRDLIANICWIIERAREFQKTKQNKTKQNKNKQTNKNICFCFIDYAKAFKCVDHNKQLKF